MGGDIIRRGPRKFGLLDFEKAREKLDRRIAKGNVRKRTEPFVLRMRGWEAQGIREVPAKISGGGAFVHSELPNPSRLAKIGETVKAKKNGERVPELGPKSEKKALAALKRLGKQEIEAERFSGFLLGEGVPTIEELGSIYITIGKSRSMDVQYCLFRVLQKAIKHGGRRIRKAADECLDKLLEQGARDYRRLGQQGAESRCF